MIQFSLVMATRGRTTEIGEFLDSVLAQGRDVNRAPPCPVPKSR